MTEAIELEAEFSHKAPTVIGLDPTKGPISGGNSVTITGTKLAEVEEGPLGGTAVELASLVDDSRPNRCPCPCRGDRRVIVMTIVAAPRLVDSYTCINVPGITGLIH